MGKLEFEWTAKDCAPERCMRIASNMDLIFPSLLPQFFVKTERLEGDGGPGTIRLIPLGPAITGGEERQNKERVTVVDEGTGTIGWELVDDHRYSKLKTTFKIIPCSNGKDSILHWEIDFEPIDGSTPPPENFKDSKIHVIEAVQKYANTHPEWP